MSHITIVNYEASTLRIYVETSTVSIISEQPSYKYVVTQKEQHFRRAKKLIFKDQGQCALSNEFVLFQNVVSLGSEP